MDLMRPLLLSCSLGIALGLAGSLSALPVGAETVSSTTMEALTASTTLALADIPTVPETRPAAIQEPPFVAFQMADGRFFHPASGLMASTEAELRVLVLGPAAGSAAGSVISGGADEEPPIPVVDPLVAAIRRAQTELQSQIAAAAAQAGAKVVKERQEWLPITLAVWQRSTDQLRYVEAKMRGTELQLAEEAAEDLDVRVLFANGLNSNISVNGNQDQAVIALRYPILKALNAKKTLFSLEDVVYVPYSASIHTPAVVEEGERYLDELVRTVFERLRTEQVRSRAYPERLLADVIDPSLVKAIAAIEHLDESSLQKDSDRALERFFVTLGGNQGSAYNYSRSTADALGLVQFIPSTYNRLAERAEWGLDKDFVRGMTTHENALRAQTIYLDTLLTEFPGTIRTQYLADPDTTTEYIVAAYNGGSGRVRRAIGTWQQIFNGERTRQLARLQKDYDVAFTKAESLRKKTLAEKDKKKRAALQGQLDAQRKVYRNLQAQIDTLQASLLRKETIGYVQKYRLTKADERFAPRTALTTTAVIQKAALID